MKRLWIALGILAVIFAATLYNAHFLNHFTDTLTDLLEQAEAQAEARDWAAARALTEEARAFWDGHALYLHVLLRHSDTDDVEIGFREVGEYLEIGEQGEYSAANARLIMEIGLLYEAEQLSLKNVL